MGSNLTKETQESWNTEDVEIWKLRAIEIIKTYYLSFRGSQFDEYVLNADENLLLAKICFAIYGPPTVENAKEIWEAYEEKQLESAKEILNLILEVHRKKKPSAKQVLVGIIFIACKQEDVEYLMPIFSVFTGHDPYNPHASRAYVDAQKRVYNNWEDWKTNNTMPMLKYAFPRRGFFTSSPNHNYEFDEEKEPDVEFASSPACSTTSRVLGTTDTVTGLTALGCGVIGLASMFTPIGPSVLMASMYGGISSAIYGSTRAGVRLYDKGTHGESMKDLESFALMFSIIATPLHFTSSIVNAQLVRGAVVNGRIFSSSMRMFATVLNFSTLGVDGVMLAFGVANLIDKAKQDQLKPLDILQFSMSVFFFTNTLIRPQMASSIIKNAQETHIQSYANNLSDAEAQATFNKFLESNKGDGSIKDTSKIIRTINKISDPNKIFGDLKGSSDIKIGGRKGKTLLVQNGKEVNRINPSKISTDVKVTSNIVGCPGSVNSEDKEKNNKDESKTDPSQTNLPIPNDNLSNGGIISGVSAMLLAPFLKELEEKFRSMDVNEIIEILYDKVLKNFPHLIKEIEATIRTILGDNHGHQTDYPSDTNDHENERLLDNPTSIELNEIVHLETSHVLGGFAHDVIKTAALNDKFEVNFAPPKDFTTGIVLQTPQTAFLMLKVDSDRYKMSAREEILTLMNDLKTAIKMEITLLNTQKFLSKYSICVLQWIECLYLMQAITKVDFVEILDHFHNLLEACEKTATYEFDGIEINEEEVKIFLNRVKEIVLLKKFVMNLNIVKDVSSKEL